MKKYDICIPICAGEHTEHERAIIFHDMLPPLHIRLRRVALLAQHLQVVVGGMPALAPRNDVVTFHILKGVLGVDAICNAQGTLMTLPLIGTKLLRFGERTKGQVLFVAPSTVREDERDDACLLGHIIIQQEFLMSASRALPACLIFHDFLIGVEVLKKPSDIFFCVTLTCLVRDL